MALPQGEEADRCRAETKARLPAFCKVLREKLPNGVINYEPPDNYQLAATVSIKLLHEKGNRKLSFQSYEKPVLANLTTDEKNTVSSAVGLAAYEAGLEVWFKLSWSNPGLLVYRVFWKPTE